MGGCARPPTDCRRLVPAVGLATCTPGDQSEPDPRPFGFLALGLGLLSGALAPTYFLSAYSYLAAALAITLGLMARGVAGVRGLGTAAVVLAGVGGVAATLTLARF